MSASLRATPEPRRLAVLEILLVAALVASPLLPTPWSALAVLLLAVVWLGLRSPRERLIAGPLVAVAILSLAAGWVLTRGDRASRAEWKLETRGEYRHLWEDLRHEAAAAVRSVGGPAETPQARLEAFRRLALIETGTGPRTAHSPAAGSGRRSRRLGRRGAAPRAAPGAAAQRLLSPAPASAP